MFFRAADMDRRYISSIDSLPESEELLNTCAGISPRDL